MQAMLGFGAHNVNNIYNDISSTIEKAADEKISTVVIGRVDECDWIFWDICRDGLRT